MHVQILTPEQTQEKQQNEAASENLEQFLTWCEEERRPIHSTDFDIWNAAYWAGRRSVISRILDMIPEEPEVA